LPLEHDGIAVRAERGRREPELHPTLPSELDVLGAGDLVLVARNAESRPRPIRRRPMDRSGRGPSEADFQAARRGAPSPGARRR
jgi:hypothetical protein